MGTRTKSRLIRGVVALLISGVYCGFAVAEGYGDHFLYDLSELPVDVLADSIGSVKFSADLTEDSGPTSPTLVSLRSYEFNGSQITPGKDISVVETQPVGKGGWGAWARYLVTERQGEYLQIIINPYNNLRIWVKPDETRGDKAIIFEDLIGRKKAVTEEIEIFLLSPEKRLFAEPRTGSSFTVLRRRNSQHKVYYPVAFTKDYVQIGLRIMDQNHVIPGEREGDMVHGEPLGWIKARDDQGRIAFHLFMCSWD